MSEASESAAVQAFQRVFEDVTSAEQSAEIIAVRERAFRRFSELGVPGAKHENWKYTNVQSIARTKFSSADRRLGSSVSLDAYQRYLPDVSGPRLVFVDGIFREDLSRITSLLISPLAPYAFDEEAAAFPSLNAALSTDGRLIRIPKEWPSEQLIQIVHIASPGSQPASEASLFLPVRIRIVAEASSRADVVEYYFGDGGHSYFRSVYVEVVCEENSIFEHTKIQSENRNAFHVSNLVVRQRAMSKFTSNVFSFGGGLVRNEIDPVLDGERIESFLNGLTVVSGKQHVDNTTVIDHAKPNCFSRELYKGIYADSARGVFSGTIIVRPDAQKTNAIQSNKSVLLSDDASIETRPQLKIWADDVKCTHGATVGQLDEDARFYLRSRGIPAEQAQAMLLQAFAGDIVGHVSSPQVRASLEKFLEEALEFSKASRI